MSLEVERSNTIDNVLPKIPLKRESRAVVPGSDPSSVSSSVLFLQCAVEGHRGHDRAVSKDNDLNDVGRVSSEVCVYANSGVHLKGFAVHIGGK